MYIENFDFCVSKNYSIIFGVSDPSYRIQQIGHQLSRLQEIRNANFKPIFFVFSYPIDIAFFTLQGSLVL